MSEAGRAGFMKDAGGRWRIAIGVRAEGIGRDNRSEVALG